MSCSPRVPDVISVLSEAEELCGLRDFTFANAVRLPGTANLSFFRRCARERVRSQP
jgi:hypothetical protein